jgi:hypothetical protein
MQPYNNGADKSGGRGRETLFRVTFRNQINLIQIADNKANMIITINSTIIAVIVSITGLGSVSQGLDFNKGDIMIPVILIILTCLSSVVYAIQAARPHLIKDSKKNEFVKSGKSSILFFGNISKMTMDEYLEGMDELLNSRQSIYKSMTIDIYNQGKVLQRKYHLLSIAYLIFMYGFVFSVLTFLVMFIIPNNI